MLKILFSICVFSAFQLTAAESYECVRCRVGECPSGKATTCTATKGCYNHRQEIRTSGELSGLLTEKGCSSETCKPLAFSATLGTKYAFGYDHQCCNKEKCNKEDLTLVQDSKPNGLECPACYAEDSLICVSAPLKCTGAETKCVVVTGTGEGSHTLFGMGCATESACDLEMLVMGGIRISTKCKAASGGSPALTPVASATLTSLFLLKVSL